MIDYEMTDDEQEVSDLLDDLDGERLHVLSILRQIRDHAGSGLRTNKRALLLMAAIEAAWDKHEVDLIRDDLRDDSEERAKESRSNAMDEDRASADFEQAGIDAIRR